MGFLGALTGPLRIGIFRSLWIATIFSNVGTLMHGVGAAWLMTTMTDSPLMVGLVPAAVMLPTFLVGLWGGVLADLFSRRLILIVTQSAMMVTALAQGFLTLGGQMSPWMLVGLTFIIGTASSLNLPAWQSQIQDIVPREQVAAAVSLNSMSFNSARAVGPALGGLIVAAAGPASVFLLNGLSYLGTVGVLLAWKPTGTKREPTAFFRAFLAGTAYVMRAPEMRAPLVRVSIFGFGASVIWAVLPLLARDDLGLGAGGYGTLLAAFGCGSLLIGGLVPGLRRSLHPDALVNGAAVVLALSVFTLATVHVYPVLLAVLFFGGFAWVGAMVQFNVAVQTSVTAEFRGRAMSFYLVCFQGSMGIGSAFHGWLASQVGLAHALIVGGFVVLAGLILQKLLPLGEAATGSQPAAHSA
ncbi:MAG: MFS transporter [Terrimicrobiaceae bacterium]|nr:MFS transporter [Terrimicrobiaceae bacterium]